ncbi:O-antigen ligase family protein [Priestia megaterium]|uniref:O-antigen ligase family protein n=1 Tax=Priestia megaterium TaxID=1404 RepID=UPI0039A247F1
MNLAKLVDNVYFLSIFLMVCVFWAFLDLPYLVISTQLLFFSVAGLKFLLKKRIRRNCFPYIIWALIWLLYCLFTVNWSINQGATISYVISVFQVILVGIMLIVTVEEKKHVELLERIIIIAGIVLVARLLIVTPSSEWGEERLGLELGMHVNHIALNLLISLMFTLKVAVDQKKKICWPLSLILTVALVMTASKKAIIIAILVFLVVIPMGKKGTVQKVKYLLIMLVMLSIMIKLATEIPAIYELAIQRMEGFVSLLLGTGDVDKSTAIREELLQTAWKVFLEHPVLGVGLNGFRFFNPENAYAHSNFLELLADCGIIGFIIYYSIYVIILKRFWMKYRSNPIYGMYMMIIFCIVALEATQITYYLESVQFVLATLFLLTKYGDSILTDKKI